MLRRSVLAVVVAAVVTPVLPAPLAAAQAPAGVTAFTLDRMDHVEYASQVDTRTRETPTQVAYTDVTAAAATPANGVQLTAAGGPSLTLAPPAGQQFAAGTTFPVGATQSATSGVYTAPPFCGYGQWTSSYGSGQATVVAATYTDGTLTSLAADVTWQCGSDPQWENARSAVRLASDVPYTLVRPRVAGADPRTAADGTAAFTVRVDNLGSASATLGTPVLDLTTAGTYAVTSDGCAGRTLAPGEGCDVALTFRPGGYGTTNGWHGGLLNVPVTGYPRTPGVPARLGGRAVPPPALPTSIRALPAAGGGTVVLTGGHQSWSGGTTAYEFARRADAQSPWTTLATADLPEKGGWLGHLDETLAPGASAEYAVRALGPLGASAYSAPLPVTRPATPPATGEVDGIVYDTDRAAPWPVVLDAADGATFRVVPGHLTVESATDGRAAVPVPMVAAPGTYPIAYGESHYVTRGHTSCTAAGTLTVTSALYDATGAVTSYAADFAGTCDTRPLHYSVRYRSATPFQGIDVAPATEWLAPVGQAVERTFTLTSAGTAPVTLGAATIDGTYAAEYAVTANDCTGRVLARGESCAVTVRVTAAAKGVRDAALNLVADTPRGLRRVVLAAKGATVPGAPFALEVYRVVGRTRVYWGEAAGDGGTPLTGYRLYRSVSGGPWTLLTELAPPRERGFMSYEDTVTPGVTYNYAAVAVNGIGESSKRAGTARRAPRGEVVFTYTLDKNSPAGIYAQNERAGSSGGGEARFDVRVNGVDHYKPAVSPDGLTLVYSAPSANGYGLWRREFSGGTPTLLTTLAGHEVDPAWSPDGRTIAFTLEPATGKESVWTVPAAGGKAVRRATSALDPTWLPDSETLIATDISTTLRLVRISRGGTRTGITGTVNGRDPAVSPDGRWLAFAQWVSYGSHWSGTVVPVGGGTPKPHFGASDVHALELAWRSDQQRIFYTSEQMYSPISHVVSVAFNPANANPFSGAAPVTDRGRETGGVYRSLGVHFTAPAHVTGRSASFAFGSTAPVAGETFTCRLDNAKPAPCTSPFRKAALAAGRHTLVVESQASGLVGSIAAHTWTVDATAPVVTVSAPASAVSLRDSVTAAYKASGAASYDVRYRTAPASAGYSAYVYLPEWQRTALTTVVVPAPAGTEVCVSVRARDAFGNLSAWTADRCAATAYDDRALSATAAWKRVASANAYLGTLTSTGTRGASLTKANVTASRVYLVVQRCSGCGSVDVFVGSTLLGRVSLHGTGADRVVLALPKRSAPVTGTLRITTTSTSPVRIDGVAVLRR